MSVENAALPLELSFTFHGVTGMLFHSCQLLRTVTSTTKKKKKKVNFI